MAHFYGTIQGARGPASRLGNKISGLSVTAQSYEGDVCVDLWSVTNKHLAQNGHPEECNYMRVSVTPHSGQGGRGMCLYTGPIYPLLADSGSGSLTLAKRVVATMTIQQKAELFTELGRELMLVE